MKPILRAVLLFITSFWLLQSHAQSKKGISKIPGKSKVSLELVKSELEALNKKIKAFYHEEDTDSIVALYARNFTFLPEYKPAIVERNELHRFFESWFKGVNNILYEKKIYKVEVFSNYVLEIGFLRLNCSAGTILSNYTGKYMIIWERNAAAQLTLLSEAFGSDRYISPSDVPYTNVVVKQGLVLERNILGDELVGKIEESDKILVRAVEQGDGQLRADGFTKDGIYMPHFGAILDGMDTLMPYMKQTYQPEAKLYTKNYYRELLNVGEFVLLHGHFKGGWGGPENGGKFEGNMLNLMKKNEKGKLLMYCQLANNDR